MKTKFNLENPKHENLLTEVIFDAFNGISVKEVLELRQLFNSDKYHYLNRLKLLYIVPLLSLGTKYKINQEIEEIIIGYLTHLIHDMPTDNYTLEATFNIQ
ncbi:hypothetical protein [Lysinibacillus endophyticus]|uniref:hypothetical protein n=1 Tax=Ureibacillus endophyticus TaxID=1978490 RepID=UPI00209EA3EF|nr:hypothetical protein [Lysinibacillus endophyticus]MCP1146161.1 hypothetical protein [Lysinibacillus endophyticus]